MIGLTGGIGSGKTLVTHFLSNLNVNVYQADLISIVLLATDHDIKQQIISWFGEEAYHNDLPDTEFLAEQIFNDPVAREQVNALVHPKVFNFFREMASKKNPSPYMIVESAILFESGYYKDFDATILVKAPLEVRIERVLKREGMTREKILTRMNSQWPDSQKEELADYIILNDGIMALTPQIMAIHQTIMEAN
ncbi:MAG: dephospho-CoA kinase [Bacteroidales bacterium]|nr:dephospho-CoA kinase [Bacteroidales bacterium]